MESVVVKDFTDPPSLGSEDRVGFVSGDPNSLSFSLSGACAPL
jgi:hypothetical protein